MQSSSSRTTWRCSRSSTRTSRSRRSSTRGRDRRSRRSSRPDPADGVHRPVHRRTDARRHRQLADLTALVKKWPYFKKFNPAVLAEGTTAKGKIVGIPTAAYAQALHYNRKLFTTGGPRPEQAADDVGAGAPVRADHLPEDRRGRLRPDGPERQHGRLDPHHRHVRPRWAHGEGLRRTARRPRSTTRTRRRR